MAMPPGRQMGNPVWIGLPRPRATSAHNDLTCISASCRCAKTKRCKARCRSLLFPNPYSNWYPGNETLPLQKIQSGAQRCRSALSHAFALSGAATRAISQRRATAANPIHISGIFPDDQLRTLAPYDFPTTTRQHTPLCKLTHTHALNCDSYSTCANRTQTRKR